MASSRVPTTSPVRGVSAPTATIDIHRGDYFFEITGATGVCTLMALLAPMFGGYAYWSWLAEVILLWLFVTRAWQRLKWSASKLPREGYYAFAKGHYRSGHMRLMQPEDAVVGLTGDSLCLSTVGGELETISLLEITNASTSKDQRTDWGKTVLGCVLLSFLSPAIAIVRFFLPWKRDIYILEVQYKVPPGYLATLRFSVDSERKADTLVTAIMAAVQSFHAQMRQAQRPTWP